MRRSKDLEKAAVKDVAEFMAVAARTAPKTRGIDNIDVVVLEDKAELAALAAKMRELSKSLNRPSMDRDSAPIETLNAVVVVGVRANPAGLDCDFCGHKTCAGLTKSGGVCAYNSIDLGIAVGSAVSLAADFRVDSRVMYSIGKACLELGHFDRSVRSALGIPLSSTGKNPFFDRK